MNLKFVISVYETRFYKLFLNNFLIFLFFLSVGLLFSNNLFARKTGFPNDTTDFFLEMNGSIKQAKSLEFGSLKKLDSARITISNSSNQVVNVFYSNQAGMCVIKIPLNEQFSVKVSKIGWVTKIIDVDTRLINRKLMGYHLSFEIDMFEDIKGLNTSVLNSTIANVTYNRYLNAFDYNYTDEINEKLRRLYEDYYKLYKEDNIAKNQNLKNSVDNQLAKTFLLESNIDSELNNLDSFANNNSDFFVANDKVIIYNRFIDSININLEDKRVNNLPENKDKIVYSVQIIALDGRLPANATFFRRCGNAQEYIYKGKFIYTLGEFQSCEGVLRMVDLVRGIGYKDAFAVAFINKKRISITEAKKRSNTSK
ncbi:MAG: hypothetical protein Q8T03_01315 [Bacteroidota bacterium]|nr:hypothetical protein [Bacteroidota bacterium]